MSHRHRETISQNSRALSGLKKEALSSRNYSKTGKNWRWPLAWGMPRCAWIFTWRFLRRFLKVEQSSSLKEIGQLELFQILCSRWEGSLGQASWPLTQLSSAPPPRLLLLWWWYYTRYILQYIYYYLLLLLSLLFYLEKQYFIMEKTIGHCFFSTSSWWLLQNAPKATSPSFLSNHWRGALFEGLPLDHAIWIPLVWCFLDR